MRWVIVVGAVVAAVALTGPALATPLLGPRTGGSVFVGPTSAHVSSILWNPAAAGLMEGTHILITGQAKLDFTSLSRRTISSVDGEPSVTGDRSFSGEQQLTAAPGGFAGITSDLSSDSITVGVAGHLVFAERVPSLPSAGYHATGGLHLAPAVTFAVSYRISRSFYAGIGVTLMFPKLDLEFQRDRALESCVALPCQVEDPAAAERWQVATSYDAAFGGSFDPSVGYNGGALLRFGDWWVGGAVDFLLLGQVRKTADVQITRAGADPVTTRGRVVYDLPIVIHLGVRRPAFRGYELLVNGSYARTSSHHDLDVRLIGDPLIDAPEWVVRHRGMIDAVAIEAGLEQPPATPVRLGARARFETSAVPTSRVAVDLVDGPKLELAGGLELRLSTRVALVATASLMAMLPIDQSASAFTPSSRVDCASSGYDLDLPACAATRDGLAIPSAAGSYWRAGSELSLGFIYDVW